MKRIGLIIERHWHYGRRLCEGIAAYSRERGGLALEFPEWGILDSPRDLRRFDGFIARVWSAPMAAALRESGRPTVDVYGGVQDAGLVLVDQNAQKIGQLAARHFIEHRFAHFAFCGYACQRYSLLRREAFVRALRLNRFDCAVFEDRDFSSEKFGRRILGKGDFDFGIKPRALKKWLRALEKPVAVFCAHDLVALDLARTCQSIGLDVPRDVAVLGVDNDPLLCDFSNPTISSIDPNPFNQSVGSGALVWRTLRRIVWIRRNVARNVNATELFAYLKLSHTTVERAFRAELGSSVRKEISKVRIEEAKRLLESTALPLSDVCSLSGFSSKAYFTAAFNAATGTTPLKWRNKAHPRHK